ncbi:MAG: V-type ATP synthase subunit D [Chlamydiae bacterium]|nr:V-type ATP synthase subunit D [Chlamydiota bacterium]
MEQIKYTKMELRLQQIKLGQLQKYLPTLQLKKAMLQLEINEVTTYLEHLFLQMGEYEQKIEGYQKLLTDPDAEHLKNSCVIAGVRKHYENIAGVEIPVFDSIEFQSPTYFLFDTPFWLEDGINGVQDLITVRERVEVLEEKKRLLENELKAVSIRVNLFEKRMIPRTEANIKRIKIFLGDQQLAAVSQAKVSKRKIEERKKKAYA